MNGVTVDIRGIPEVQKALAQISAPEINKVLQRATAAGGKALKPIVLAEMPRRSGDLQKSLWVHRAKRQRPATVVGRHKKPGWYWHIVIGGARPHRIRFPNQVAAGVERSHLDRGVVGGGNIRHPGAPPNPFISRAAKKGVSAYERAVAAVIDKHLASL